MLNEGGFPLMNQSKIRKVTVAAALAVSFLLAPGLAEAQTKVKSGYNMFSPEQDIEIGRQSASEAERQFPILSNGNVENFVNEVGARLAAEAPGPKFRYQFRVVDASDLNAFALPGGFLYINRGVLESARNEGEVAGVLAHEIAHIALRHGTQNASKAYLAQAGVGLLGAVLGGKVGNNTGQIINVLGGFGLNALFLKYSRGAETDADVIGAQILARAGYNPADMVAFFRTLEKTDKRKTTNFMASHPAPAQRIQRIEKEAALLRVGDNPTQSTASLDRVKSTLRGMPPARTTEQIVRATPTSRAPQSRGGNGSGGTIRVDPPSREVRTFTNRDRLFQVAHPANWRVYEGSGSAVTIAPEGGAGELNGNNEVVYGAVINHYEPFGNVRMRDPVTAENATDDLLAQIQKSSPHLKVVRGSGRAFRLSGGKGLGATLVGTSPSTRIRERVTVVTRQLADGHLIYMLFITPDEDAQSYSNVLNTMVETFRVDERH